MGRLDRAQAIYATCASRIQAFAGCYGELLLDPGTLFTLASGLLLIRSGERIALGRSVILVAMNQEVAALRYYFCGMPAHWPGNRRKRHPFHRFGVSRLRMADRSVGGARCQWNLSEMSEPLFQTRESSGPELKQGGVGERKRNRDRLLLWGSKLPSSRGMRPLTQGEGHTRGKEERVGRLETGKKRLL